MVLCFYHIKVLNVFDFPNCKNKIKVLKGIWFCIPLYVIYSAKKETSSHIQLLLFPEKCT